MSKLMLTDAQREALREICSRGRDIVTVECAERLLAPFDLNPRDMSLVYEAEAGVDWGAGAERWESGEQVDVSTLAWALAEQLDAPDVPYPTDYIGAGKRAEAVTVKSVLRLKKLAGEHVATCDDCGTANLSQGNGSLCYGCNRSRQEKQQMAEVVQTNWAEGYTFNGVDVSGRVSYEVRIRFFGMLDKPGRWDRTAKDMLARFYWVKLGAALNAAYKRNREVGLIGPVNLVLK